MPLDDIKSALKMMFTLTTTLLEASCYNVFTKSVRTKFIEVLTFIKDFIKLAGIERHIF